MRNLNRAYEEEQWEVEEEVKEEEEEEYEEKEEDEVEEEFEEEEVEAEEEVEEEEEEEEEVEKEVEEREVEEEEFEEDIYFPIISLSYPNEEFIYLDAPYINFKVFSNSIIDIQYIKVLKFRSYINDYFITCDEIFKLDNDTYQCSLVSNNLFRKLESGDYNLSISNNLISTVFLSKPLSEAQIIFEQLEEIYLKNNSIIISSNNTRLDEVKKINFNEDNNDNFEYSIKKIETGNSTSKIEVKIDFKRIIVLNIMSLERENIFDEETCYSCIHTLNYPFNIGPIMFYSKIQFNRYYIIQNINEENDDYFNIIISCSNFTQNKTKIKGMYIVFPNGMENKMNLTEDDVDKYSYNVKNEDIGVYKFKLKFENERSIDIDESVVVVDKFSDLFIFNYQEFIFSSYSPIISFNPSLNISYTPEVNISIYDINNNKYYDFEYKNEEYHLSDKNIANDTNHSIIIKYNNDILFNESVKIISSPLTKDIYYKNRFEFYGNESVNLLVKTQIDDNKNYSLKCNATTRKCEFDYNFKDTMKENFYIFYNYTNNESLYEKKTIYNNFESCNINVLNITSDDGKTDIIVYSKNYKMSNIQSIKISNKTYKEFEEINDNYIKINIDYISNQTIEEIEVNEDNNIEIKDSFVGNENLPINYTLDIQIDNKILLISKYKKEEEIKIHVKGNYINSIYYKLKDEKEFKNEFIKQNNDDESTYYSAKVNKNGTYVFAYSLLNSNKTYSYNKNKKIIFSDQNFFNYDTQCILINNYFQIDLNSLLTDNELEQINGRILNNKNKKIESNCSKNGTIYKCEPLKEGNYTLQLSQDNNNILYELPIQYSNFTHQQVYYKDYIYFNDTICAFDLLGIKLKVNEDSSIIPLICNYDLNKLICKIPNNFIFGEYQLYYGRNPMNKTISIYNTLTESVFNIIEPTINNDIFYPGTLSITIENTNGDFYMDNLDIIQIISNKGNEESRNIKYNKNRFSFKFTGIEGHTYSFYLFSKKVDDYYPSMNISLQRTFYIQHSLFNMSGDSIALIDKSNQKNKDIEFVLEFEKSELTSNNIREIYINSEKNNNNQLCRKVSEHVNCKYSPKLLEATILTIKYKFWIRYFYIFAYESTGSICPHQKGEIIFNLQTTKYFPNEIIFNQNECPSSEDHSFKYYICKIIGDSNSTIEIKTSDVYNKLFSKKIDLSSNEINNTITGITGKLIEGSLSQQLTIYFEKELLNDEITSCSLINIKSNNEIRSQTPILTSNKYQRLLIFDLIGVNYQNKYNLSCEDKCKTIIKYDKIINITKLKCSPPLFRVEQVNPSCKLCNETSETEHKYEEGKCVEKCSKEKNNAINPNDDNVCSYCLNIQNPNEENPKCEYNCPPGTVEKNKICYFPDDEMVKNISKDDFCRSFCNYQHTMDCDKEKMICICKNGYKGLYCEYPNDVDSIDKVLEAINRYSIANNDFNYSNPSLVSQIKSGISLIENSGVTIPNSTTDNMEIFMIN